MTRILVVDNDQDWLDLIKGSLPDYQVDTALSYESALQAIQNGISYDVAIVDLNLIDSPNRNTRDLLGGRILDALRDICPLTRRIALTAYPPGSVKRVLDQYIVDDLLLKGNMALSVVPEVVQAALARTSAEIPPGIRAQRSDLRQDFDKWRQGQAVRFERQLRHLGNELGSSALRVGEDHLTLSTMQAQLADLGARKGEFDRKCSRIAMIIGSIDSEERIHIAQLEIDNIKRMLDAGDCINGQ
jgi:CheY-like chemotaxis protein